MDMESTSDDTATVIDNHADEPVVIDETAVQSEVQRVAHCPVEGSVSPGSFVSLKPGAVVPDDFDLAGAHLIEVDSDMAFTVTCGPLTSGTEDPEVRSSFIDRGCLVKRVCTEEFHPGAGELDNYGGFVDHGSYHMPEGDSGSVGFSIPMANVCGLYGFLAEGHDAWLRDLVSRRGPGRYLVNAATASDGCVVGVSPIKVVG